MPNPIPQKTEWIALLCLSALLLPTTGARAQNAALGRERVRLDQEQAALDAEKKSFNSDCGRVRPDDAAKIRSCQERQQKFSARLKKYMEDLATYQKRLQESESVARPADLRDAVASKPPDIASQRSVLKAIRSSLSSPGELYAKCTRHFYEVMSDTNLREFLQLIYGQYRSSQITADEVRKRMASKAALEGARSRAIESLLVDMALLESLEAKIRRGRQELLRDPDWREVFQRREALMREVELEADRRMKASLVISEDKDLVIFDPERQLRIWPGPQNPNQPPPDPISSEAKFEKMRELVLWERREQGRVDRLFKSHSDLLDYLVEDVVPRLKR